MNSGRQRIEGMDVMGLKKWGQGLRSWIRVDASGQSQIIEIDKFTVMRRCNLSSRDLRLLDPLFLYPSTILGREKAIVVNLEQIRCLITADEVLLLNSLDSYGLKYVQRGLQTTGAGDYLPFEFRALEVALKGACTFLDSQVEELEIEAYPLLDEVTSKMSTLNLQRVRGLKSKLVALTRRVEKVRDEIEQLMDNDGDMAEMYLTQKKRRMEEASDSRRSSDSAKENIQELEMLLEAYFVVIDITLNKLTSLKENIDDTEDFINVKLDCRTQKKEFTFFSRILLCGHV